MICVCSFIRRQRYKSVSIFAHPKKLFTFANETCGNITDAVKYFIPLLFVLVGCTGKPSSIADAYEISNVIDLDAGLKSVQTVKLSEIADSVTFLPLETTRNSLFGATKDYISFTPSYIFDFDKYFEWTGKFGGKVGSRGNGPLEEPQGVLNSLFADNHFYSKGSKFIEYDLTGKPTQKVRNLYSVSDLHAGKAPGAFVNASGFFVSGDYFAIYDYPSTMYFFDKNFETVSSRVVTEVETVQILPGRVAKSNYVSYYKNHVLFYNFMNDTIFYVKDTGLEPQWMVSYNDSSRYPTEIVIKSDYGKLTSEAMRARREGKYEDSEWAQLTEKKHKVTAVYETELYLFFTMIESIRLAESRGLQPAVPYIVLYEKSTGKTVRVKGSGFVDDLLGMDFFYPALGVYDENLITAIWPYELLEYLNESKAKGREVHPQLLTLSKQVKKDDNPVLIFVHLKKGS